MGNDVATIRNTSNLLNRKPDKYFQILCHGSEKKVIIDGRKFKPEELVVKMFEIGYKKGEPVRLIACLTGNKPNGFASKLAKLLDIEVIAPTNKIKVDQFGEFIHYKNGNLNHLTLTINIMKTIGFINQYGEEDFAKDIHEYFIEGQENEDREMLIEYMEKGLLCVPLMGAVEDYFMEEVDEDFIAYIAAYSDGEWLWPHYIVSYMKKYPTLHLDEEFVQYVKNNQKNKIEVSDERLLELEQAYYDAGDWQETGE